MFHEDIKIRKGHEYDIRKSLLTKEAGSFSAKNPILLERNILMAAVLTRVVRRNYLPTRQKRSVAEVNQLSLFFKWSSKTTKLTATRKN